MKKLTELYEGFDLITATMYFLIIMAVVLAVTSIILSVVYSNAIWLLLWVPVILFLSIVSGLGGCVR